MKNPMKRTLDERDSNRVGALGRLETDGVALPETVLSQVRARLQKRTLGSAFSAAAAGATLTDVLAGR